MFSKYRGELILFFVTLIAASGWFFSKFSLREFPPMGFMGGRFLTATLIYLPFAYPQIKKLSIKQITNACLVGFCYTIYLILWLLGLLNSQYFGEGAFLVSLSMLVVPIMSWLFFKDKPMNIFWVSLPLAILGLYLLSLSKGGVSLSLGNLIFLLSSISAAIYFVLNNRFAHNIPALPLTTLQVAVVGVCCTAYSFFFEDFPENISSESWFWFIASLLIATNLRMLLQTIGQKYCQVSNAAMIMLLEPVWTLILSMMILGEQLDWIKSFGCLCILMALVIYRLPKSLIKKSDLAKNSKI
ncbi:DMT family transporter [Glaesserella parasuis]|uniref:DMT family transporter n=1 Tax=Glaesserella parasuis TaxID=738 RepID=UPI003854EA13